MRLQGGLPAQENARAHESAEALPVEGKRSNPCRGGCDPSSRDQYPRPKPNPDARACAVATVAMRGPPNYPQSVVSQADSASGCPDPSASGASPPPASLPTTRYQIALILSCHSSTVHLWSTAVSGHSHGVYGLQLVHLILRQKRFRFRFPTSLLLCAFTLL